MIQSQARRVLADLRADIARRGYPLSEKRYLLHAINDMKLAEASKPGAARIVATLPGEAPALTPIQSIEARLRKDRDSADGGASTIHAILSELEEHVQRLLPVAEPKIEEKSWPAMLGAKPAAPTDEDIDRLIERMRERRAAVPA